MKHGISGYICVRNAIDLDYCVREAALSLIPVVDELVLCDGESTDGTRDIISGLAALDSRVRVITYPWPNPERDIHFWVNWLNFARLQLAYDTQLELDADEILDPASHNQIRALRSCGKSALFRRLNFWKDHKHLAPHNRVCGEMVARLGPTSLYCPSDEPIPAQSPNLRTFADEYPALRIFHYGFLRKPDSFLRKSAVVQKAFFGSVDERIARASEGGKHWVEYDYFNGEPLRPFNEQHPEVARAWLKERGYE